MIPIVFSTDHNYVMPAGVTITSLLISAPEINYDIYILASPDVNEEDKAMLKEQVALVSPASRISFIEMGDKFEGGYEIREISTACYYRLMIPWLIPNVDKIIYADVDIIFKTSLKELFEIDLKENYVAGSYPNTSDGWKAMQKYFEKIGADYKAYINSGLLVINSKLQREQNLESRYNELAKNNYLYQDQDIINIVCKGRIAHFNRRFNLMPKYYGNDNKQSDCVIHYVGDKPWKTFSYAWAEWWEVYKKSIFWDASFYRAISERILSPKEQLKSFRRKSFQKLKQILSKF